MSDAEQSEAIWLALVSADAASRQELADREVYLFGGKFRQTAKGL